MSRVLSKKSIWIIFVIFCIGNFLPILKAESASLHTLSDRVSRHAPLVASTHEFKFNTPSGVGEAGDYIRISFASGFDLSSILYTDVTLSHGLVTGLESTKTISAAPTATNWGFTVSGNHFDLIHPTNALNGDIAPAEVIIIKVGTVNKIINPADLGSKVIVLSIYNVANNIIDTGRLAVPIAEDQVGVIGVPNGTILNPVILNFPYNVTTSSLDLDWSENSDAIFERYELYMGNIAGVTNLNGTLLIGVTDRTQTIFNIDGLAPNRTYYFIVYVFDTVGNYVASNEVFATTQNTGGTGWPNPPEAPTITERTCPIFWANETIDGTKPASTTIYINGSNENVNYPTDLLWNKLVALNLGTNLFLIYAQDSYGQASPILTATVNRCEVGDTDCNTVIDDFDLSGLAYHWNTGWCNADFNNDGLVDDFDLSGLAAHWDIE